VVEVGVREVNVLASVLVALVHAGVALVELLHQVGIPQLLAVTVLELVDRLSRRDLLGEILWVRDERQGREPQRAI
jgi:hypothetical protein